MPKETSGSARTFRADSGSEEDVAGDRHADGTQLPKNLDARRRRPARVEQAVESAVTDAGNFDELGAGQPPASDRLVDSGRDIHSDGMFVPDMVSRQVGLPSTDLPETQDAALAGDMARSGKPTDTQLQQDAAQRMREKLRQACARVEELAHEAGTGMTEVSKRVKCAPSSWHNWKGEKNVPSVFVMLRYAVAVGADIQFMIVREGDQQTAEGDGDSTMKLSDKAMQAALLVEKMSHDLQIEAVGILKGLTLHEDSTNPSEPTAK